MFNKNSNNNKKNYKNKCENNRKNYKNLKANFIIINAFNISSTTTKIPNSNRQKSNSNINNQQQSISSHQHHHYHHHHSQNDQHSTTMFAAAAVAAAAALTAISATSTNISQNLQNNHHQNGGSFTSVGSQANSTRRAYVSWAQYAHERRNSLQRRKFEISKRLENASKANKAPIKKDIDQFKPKNQNQILTKQTSAAANNINKNKMNQQNNRNNNKSSKNEILIYLNSKGILTESLCHDLIEYHKLRKHHKPVLNEFELKNTQIYKNFQMQTAQLGPPHIDINELSGILYEYFQTSNTTDQQQQQQQSTENENKKSSDKSSSVSSLNEIVASAATTITAALNNNNNNNGAVESNKEKLNRQRLIIQESNKKKEEKLRYLLAHRWDPKWLKMSRSFFCIPFAFITLVLLLFTCLNSNWVHFYGNLNFILQF